jgi:hypothetical protein
VAGHSFLRRDGGGQSCLTHGSDKGKCIVFVSLESDDSVISTSMRKKKAEGEAFFGTHCAARCRRPDRRRRRT